MVLNYLLTIGIVGAIVIGGKRYYDANIKGKVFDDFTEEENPRADFDMIVREVNAEFSRMTKRNINDDRLTREELAKKRKHIATLRDNLERAGFGDTNAKLYVKNYIKDILVANSKIQVSEENINDILMMWTNFLQMTVSERYCIHTCRNMGQMAFQKWQPQANGT